MSLEQTVAALSKTVEQLAHDVAVLQDVNAIRKLHHAYGYYIDKCLYEEVIDLFAEDSATYFLNGAYRGKAGARRLYVDWFRQLFTKGHNGPGYGFLLDHLILQDIVDVAPDRTVAKARFRCFMQGGSHASKTDAPEALPQQFWEGGIYENEYVREDGVWKIKLLNYNMLWQANYAEGWAHSEAHLALMDKTYPENPIGPDAFVDFVPHVWPETRVVPFHYPHPVTGKPSA